MTNSLAFPNMFNIANNCVSVLEDNTSIVNRVRLLILTEPTELYNSPNFGVGLKRHLWQYNTDNEKAIIRDRVVEQLRLHEPCCDAEKTQFADGLLFTGSDELSAQNFNQLKMTIAVQTTFGDTLEIESAANEIFENGLGGYSK
ncbi:MAG: GPW/gp25 family protein [Bacteroides sp.]|nr:GPW/gp25 family protein [Bacteroides sp.]MCM1361764.1 GPW/gp25 family protein [Clostridiales bacterium]